MEVKTKLIIILVRKDIGSGVWSKSIKSEGVWLRWTQNCLPRPWTHIWSEINRCIVPQILIRYIKDKLKDILLFTVDSKQLDFICPNDSAGQNYKSVLIKVYIYSQMTIHNGLGRKQGDLEQQLTISELVFLNPRSYFMYKRKQHSIFPDKNIN